MKHLYVNSRIHAICLPHHLLPVDWRWSQGMPWLLLTPVRMGRLAGRLGLGDPRVERLVRLIRLYAARPLEFCRPLGLEAESGDGGGEYPPVVCPRCDSVHNPHPVDASFPCRDCVEKEREAECLAPTPRALADKAADVAARAFIAIASPELHRGGELAPYCKDNASRRLDRDWDAAVGRIRMGMSYRRVAREFDCSVGVLHKRVMERKYWENN